MRRSAVLDGSTRRPAVVVEPGASAPSVLRQLRWRRARGLVIVNGGTRELPEREASALAQVLREGVTSVAAEEGLDLLTGATDAGVFRVLGMAIEAQQVRRRVVGVAPAHLVAWTRDRDAPSPDLVALEPHHTDFVLVDGVRWGDETQVMLALARELDRHQPSVVVLAAGGGVARAELRGHVAAGRPAIVLEGTGGLADQLAEAYREGGSETDPEINEMVHRGRLIVLDVHQDAAGAAVAREIRALLAAGRRRSPITLPAALRRLPSPRWRPPDPQRMLVELDEQVRYPTLARDLSFLNDHLLDAYRSCDTETLRLQRSFYAANLAVIAGSLVATVLGVIQAADIPGRFWYGLVETVLAAALGGGILLSAARGAQRGYYTTRLKAERLRAEYFLFLARHEPYAKDATRDRLLKERVVAIVTAGGPRE